MWLESQIFKTEYARGFFKQALLRLDTYLEELDEKFDFIGSGDKVDPPSMEYLFYKLVYMKCKLQRKLRLLTDAEDTCNLLIEQVSESKREPQKWWKFALKASYLKVHSLAAVMEFAKPRAIMEKFGRVTLYKMIRHFKPELTIIDINSAVKVAIAGNEGLFEDSHKKQMPQEGLPEEYHCFEFRRVWAKLRNLAYFVPDSEKFYRSLLHDQLRLYNFYDFSSFESENPLIIEEQESGASAVAEESKKEDESLIEVVENKVEEEKKAEETKEKDDKKVQEF